MTSTQKTKNPTGHTVACSAASHRNSTGRLATGRLEGIPLNESHRELYCQLHQDPAIMAQIGPTLSPAQASRSFDAALKSCQNTDRFYWAFQTQSGQIFAIAGLAFEAPAQAQIGCLLLADHHGKGYATEMLRAITHCGFTRLELAAITSFSSVKNTASDVLMQKLGYRRTPLAALPNGLGEGYTWRLSNHQWAKYTEAVVES